MPPGSPAVDDRPVAWARVRPSRRDRGSALTAVNVLVFIAVLMVLVLIHEAGHFVVARRCGMRVERFSIFFGRPLLRWTRGETEYCLGWLPLGGYVRITGMTRDEELPPEVAVRAYHSASTPRKVATILAGPVVNLVAAVLCFAIAFWIGLPQTVGITDRVASVLAGSPAAGIGLRPGDRILSVNGVATRPDPGVGAAGARNVQPVRAVLEANPGKVVTVRYARGAQVVRRQARPRSTPGTGGKPIGILGFTFDTVSRTVSAGPLQGARLAWDQTTGITRQNFEGLGRLFTSAQARRETGTVLTIGRQYNNQIAGRGAGLLIWFVGVISLLLGIYNLLPLFPLDGGHIAFALVERATGRQLSRRVYERVAILGLVLLGLLFVTALRNDVWRFTGGGP